METRALHSRSRNLNLQPRSNLQNQPSDLWTWWLQIQGFLGHWNSHADCTLDTVYHPSFEYERNDMVDVLGRDVSAAHVYCTITDGQPIQDTSKVAIVARGAKCTISFTVYGRGSHGRVDAGK